jgi:Tol biopolymer transport system component
MHLQQSFSKCWTGSIFLLLAICLMACSSTPQPSRHAVQSTGAPSITPVPHPIGTRLPGSGGGTGWLAFHSDTAGFGQDDLYLIKSDGSGQTRLTVRLGAVAPVWSPDGRRIVVDAYRDTGPRVNILAEIYVLNSDGSGLARLTFSPTDDDEEPSWSPDGSQIVWISNADGKFAIYLMQSDGSQQRRLTDSSASNMDPTWSPDGKRLAFTSERDGNAEIYVMNADGSHQRRLTSNAAPDRTPVWSPDGKQLAFYSERDGAPAIYVMKADGLGQTRLLKSAYGLCCYMWSPNGKQIAFVEGKAEISVMKSDGSGRTRLTKNDANFDGEPVWSPDGTKIAFTSQRDGDAEVYVMNADGSEQTRLTYNRGDDHFASWQPRDPSQPDAGLNR